MTELPDDLDRGREGARLLEFCSFLTSICSARQHHEFSDMPQIYEIVILSFNFTIYRSGASKIAFRDMTQEPALFDDPASDNEEPPHTSSAFKPLATAPSILCAACGTECDPLLVTSCFHIYCQECMHERILKNTPCASCGVIFFDFKEYKREDVIDADGEPNDARVEKALKIAGGAPTIAAGTDATTRLNAEVNGMLVSLAREVSRPSPAFTNIFVEALERSHKSGESVLNLPVRYSTSMRGAVSTRCQARLVQ